jgi:hypothetical protein
MPGPRKDRRTSLPQRLLSVAAVGTCPVAEVLAGSTWAAAAGRMVPPADRSRLVADMGPASRRNSCLEALVGCRGLGVPFGHRHRRPEKAAEAACTGTARRQEVRPMRSAGVHVCGANGQRGVAQHWV